MVSGSADNIKVKRVEVLKLIQEKKDILFGNVATVDKSSSTIDKHQAWQDVTAMAQSMGCYPVDKDWKYLRDTTWQNWRKRVVEKRDKIMAADPQSRSRIKYDFADLLILDIIGSKAPDGRTYKMIDYPAIKTEMNYGNGEEADYQDQTHLEQSYQEQPYHIFRMSQLTEQKYQQQCNEEQYFEPPEEPVEEYVEEEILDEQETENQADEHEHEEPEEECPEEPIVTVTTDENSSSYPINYLQKLTQSVNANTAPITVIRKSLTMGGAIFTPTSNQSHNSKVSYFANNQPKLSFLQKTNNIAQSRKRPLHLQTVPDSPEEDLESLQKNKLRLKIKLYLEQMRLAERERYKLDLELLKLERELNLPPSKFTRNFFSLSNNSKS